MKSNSAFRIAILALAVAAPLSSMAQSMIKHADQPYKKQAEMMISVDASPAPESLPTPIISAPAQKNWLIMASDVRLATTLTRWTKLEGYKLIWDAPQHVMLSSGDSFDGTFEESLTRVLSSPAIKKSAFPLEACIYPNNPPVVRITRLGEQTNECPQ